MHLGLLPPLPWQWVWLLDATQAVNGRSSGPLVHSVISLGKHLFPFTSLSCVIDTEEQTDEEIFKAKSGRVPSTSTGASVAMQMGCGPRFPACKYPQPRSSVQTSYYWDFSGDVINWHELHSQPLYPLCRTKGEAENVKLLIVASSFWDQKGAHQESPHENKDAAIT